MGGKGEWLLPQLFLIHDTGTFWEFLEMIKNLEESSKGTIYQKLLTAMLLFRPFKVKSFNVCNVQCTIKIVVQCSHRSWWSS